MKEIIVEEKDINKRIDNLLSEQEKDLSREQIKRMLLDKSILVNDNVQKPSYKVKLNDKISIGEIEVKETKLKAQDIKLDIIYEDKDIIVINKPKGMVVHPGNGNEEGTLVNAILSICKGSLSGIGGEVRPGIVHRLDKDTSGILIVAKNDKAHINISKQIEERRVVKKYIALVRGVIPEN